MEAAKAQDGQSVVRKLLRDISDTNVPVATLLRTAKIMAAELEQNDALIWIERELNGYVNLPNDALPPYRHLAGELKALNPYRGWMPVFYDDADTARLMSTAIINSSIGSIEDSLKRGGRLSFHLTPERKKIIWDSMEQVLEIELMLDASHMAAIVEKVRNLLLDWALELKKAGVVGADMDFTADEKKDATIVTQQFFIQNAGVVGNVGDNAMVSNNQTATANLDISAITAMVQQARAHLGSLPADQRNALEPVLNDIEAEAIKPAPDRGALGTLLTSARTICEQAAGNLAATGIIGLIGSILGA